MSGLYLSSKAKVSIQLKFSNAHWVSNILSCAHWCLYKEERQFLSCKDVKSSSTYISYAVLGPYFSRHTQCHLFCYIWLRKIQPTEKVRFLVSCFQTFELREPLFFLKKKIDFLENCNFIFVTSYF